MSSPGAPAENGFIVINLRRLPHVTANSSPFRPEKWGYCTPQSKKWGTGTPRLCSLTYAIVNNNL